MPTKKLSKTLPLRKERNHPIQEDRRKANFQLRMVAVPFQTLKQIKNPSLLFPILKEMIALKQNTFPSFSDCPYLVNHAFFMLKKTEDGVKHKPELRFLCVIIDGRCEIVRPEAFLEMFVGTKIPTTTHLGFTQ